MAWLVCAKDFFMAVITSGIGSLPAAGEYRIEPSVSPKSQRLDFLPQKELFVEKPVNFAFGNSLIGETKIFLSVVLISHQLVSNLIVISLYIVNNMNICCYGIVIHVNWPVD